jgi:hypothetical protein
VEDPRTIRDTLGVCLAGCGSDAPPEPVVTLSDLASFSPTTPTIRMEPDGWMLTGLPANFIADTTINTHDGVLLGHDVTVRFTPTTYTWAWGDGTTDTFTTPGRTWEDLGVDDFTATDTSHTYTDRGTVTVSLTVGYTVAYALTGGTWHTVDGTVTATHTLDAYVGTADTVIVDGDCHTDPTAPGC